MWTQVLQAVHRRNFEVSHDELNPVKECAVGSYRKLCQHSGLVDFRVLQKSPESVIVSDVQFPTEWIVNNKYRADGRSKCPVSP